MRPCVLAQLAASANHQYWWLYVAFLGLVFVFLALDLGVFHRHAHEVKLKEAITWTVVWIACAMVFNVGIYFIYEHHLLGIGENVAQIVGEPRHVDGWEAARLFFTGYVVEKSLSVDNVFIIGLIFTYFKIPAKYQHRVLFWGILGALLMRGLMIGVGAALLSQFKWVLYIFGAVLLATAVKMLLTKEEHIQPERNLFVRFVKRLYPVTGELDGQRFLTKIGGVRHATPLLLALVMVEFTDLVFAVDSIPAIFLITLDPFLVFTSNVFAILGLRALYFCLASLMHRFKYLKLSLVVILLFVGGKMFLVPLKIHLSETWSLGIIVLILAAGVLASVVADRRETGRTRHSPQNAH